MLETLINKKQANLWFKNILLYVSLYVDFRIASSSVTNSFKLYISLPIRLLLFNDLLLLTSYQVPLTFYYSIHIHLYIISDFHLISLKMTIISVLIFVLVTIPFGIVMADLRVGFYNSTCPNAESIIRQVVRNRFMTDPSITAALLRMHFHDCFVRVSVVLLLDMHF